MSFPAALPNLTALQWLEAEEASRKYDWYSVEAFADRPWTGMQSAQSLAGQGLRLLQAKQCSFAAVPALPASLQTYSLRNWDRKAPGLLERLHLLLAPCAALRELRISFYNLFRAASLDLPSVAATCPALRVLVLHVLTASHRGVCPCTASCTTLPSSRCPVIGQVLV